MSNFEKYVNPPRLDRGQRILNHRKRDGTVPRVVVGVDKNQLKEGISELFYIKGKGFYWVTKYNNQLKYAAHTESI